MSNLMKFAFAAIVAAVTAIALTGPAGASTKHHGKRHAAHVKCVDRPYAFSWDFLWSIGNGPRWNGCAPPVHEGGEFIGQDPDPNVRLQLRRDPDEGYKSLHR